jgi:hypothetical protein
MGEGRKVYRVLVVKSEGKNHLKDQGIDGGMGLGWGGGGVEWIHLAQDKDQRQAVVNVVMKLWVLVPRS